MEATVGKLGEEEGEVDAVVGTTEVEEDTDGGGSGGTEHDVGEGGVPPAEAGLDAGETRERCEQS